MIFPLIASAILASFHPASAPTPDDLMGEWDVALYYGPDAAPSATRMVVTSIEEGSLEGSFYGTPFSKGRVTAFEGAVIFSVVTSDGSGEYLTSGRLVDGEIKGQTHSLGRQFLMPWTAQPAATSDASSAPSLDAPQGE